VETAFATVQKRKHSATELPEAIHQELDSTDIITNKNINYEYN